MNILTEIESRWTPENGMTIAIRKGTLRRMLNIPPWNKWDICGYTDKTMVLRGDPRPLHDRNPYIRERGRRLTTVNIFDYLQGFEIEEMKAAVKAAKGEE